MHQTAPGTFPGGAGIIGTLDVYYIYFFIVYNYLHCFIYCIVYVFIVKI